MKNLLFFDTALPIIEKNGYKVDEKNKKNLIIKHFKVNQLSQQSLKKAIGDYYTVHYQINDLLENNQNIIREVKLIITKLLKSYHYSGKILVVGLGNSSFAADALGPKTTNKIIPTNHLNDFITIPKVALFVPEVINKTGISSYALIAMLVAKLKPEAIIMIDAYATNNYEWLNSCIEINDTGIIPGSATLGDQEICKDTFGIPVIAIGVPLLIKIKQAFFTSPNIELLVDKASTVVAEALNLLFLNY